jgi:hypothetical protein
MNLEDVILLRLREEEESLVRAVAEGRPATFDEYKRLCGVVQGLRIAINHIHDLKDLMESSDD